LRSNDISLYSKDVEQSASKERADDVSRREEMKKLGLVALGFVVLVLEGCEKAVELAQKEGEEFLTAYKAAQKERQEAKK